MYQKTIRNQINIKGIGLHSGLPSVLSLFPGEEDSGIVFSFGENDNFNINPYLIEQTPLSTKLSVSGHTLLTIEHLMSALYGLGIDNIKIRCTGSEIPIMDGSSSPFVFALQAAGITVQNKKRHYIKIIKDVYVKHEDKYACIKPSEFFLAEFEISYHNKFIDNTPQKVTFDSQKDSYIHTLCRARTFGFEKEISHLKDNNLILGGSLSNALVLTDEMLLNPEGLRWSDEFVKHKLLDALGDLYVINKRIIGHYKGYKSGHILNNKLARAILDNSSNYTLIEL